MDQQRLPDRLAGVLQAVQLVQAAPVQEQEPESPPGVVALALVGLDLVLGLGYQARSEPVLAQLGAQPGL
jgi:hypothetical protein